MLDGIAKSPADVTMETDFKYASTEIAATLKGKSDQAMSERTLSCKWDIFIKSLPSSLRNLSRRKRRRRRNNAQCRLQGNSVFQTQQARHTAELIETGATCTRPEQV